MATIKLNKSNKRSDPSRPPVRGGNRGAQPRPTLGQAQAQRVERDARYDRDAKPQGGGGQGFGDRREQRPAGDRSYGGQRPGGDRSYGGQRPEGDRSQGGQRPQGDRSYTAQREPGRQGFGRGPDSRGPSQGSERHEQRPPNRAFDARSDRGTAPFDNRPAPVAAGMGQKFDEKRFYEERNRTPRAVEPQPPEQRYPQQRYDEQRGYEGRGYEQRGHEQHGYEQRGYEQRGHDDRGWEQRPYAGRGDERPREFQGNERPYAARSDERGPYGQQAFQPRREERPSHDNRTFEQRPQRSQGEERRPFQPRGDGPRPFEPRRDEPRRYEPQRFDERPQSAPLHARRDEAPRHERGDAGHRGAAQEQHAPGAVRLSKRMSELGLASRREADEWIEKGWIRVDGKVVSRLGIRVLPEQQITIDPRAKHEQAARVTVLLNKPVGYVSGQAEDGYEPAVVLFTADNHWAGDPSGIAHDRLHLKYLAPAGRLDIESVGLLVLTQDGRVARQLIGEDSDIEKEYLVRVEYRGRDADFSDETNDAVNDAVNDEANDATDDVPDDATGNATADADSDSAPTIDPDQPVGPTARQSLPEADLALLNHGLELDGEALIPARVEWLNDDQLRFVLREGKKRQIRRMCQAVGLQVTGLKRVRIGKVMLGDLPTGQWRYLAPGESFV